MGRFGRAGEGFPCGFMRPAHGISSRDAFSDPFNAPDHGSLQRGMLRLAGGRAAGLGRVVTADAMPTQRRTARAVTAAGGDHVPTLKGNQGALYEDAKPYSDDPARDGNWPCYQDVDGGHGRIGTRSAGVAHDIGRLQQRHRRPGPAAVGKVVPTRGTGAGTTTGIRHRITGAEPSPQRFRRTVRSRWAIGNPPHRVSDVTMNGDRRRNRTGHGPETPALLRRLASNVARAEPGRDAMRGKPKRAGWDNNFLPDMIRAAKPHNTIS